jgi:hypothetical protein
MHRFADRIADVFGPRFIDGLADSVAAGFGFVDRLVNHVADVFGPRFPDGLADGVAAGFGFVDRLVDRVADVFGPRFPDGLTDGVAAGFGFVDRLVDRVADVFGPRFPDRLTDGVGARSVFCFIDRLADRVATFPVARFGYVFDAVDGLGFPNWFVACFVTGVLLLLVNHFLAGFHDSVALLFATTVVGRRSTRSATTQTCCSAIARFRRACKKEGQRR